MNRTNVELRHQVLRQVLRQHGALLLAIARRLTGNVSDAADLLHDTIETTLSRAPNRLSAGELRAWMVVVMRNRFYDGRRHQRVVRRLNRAGEALVVIENLHGHPANDDGELERWKQIDSEDLRAAVAGLSREFREPISLWLDGSSLAEIGRCLGILPATVGTRLHRARKKLRATLLAYVAPLAA